MNNKNMMKKAIVGVIAVSMLSISPIFSVGTAVAADCKTANTCTVPNTENHQGSEMSTVSGAGPVNHAAQSGAVKNQFSEANTGKTARTWTKTAKLNCTKGTMTIHISDNRTKCPNGFTKKK